MIAVLVIILAGVLIIYNFNSSGVAFLIKVVPSDAKIIIDQKEFKANSKIRLPKGEYTINISRFGFKDYTAKHQINSDNQVIPIALAPITPEATEWMNNHASEYLEIEGLMAQNTNQRLAKSKTIPEDYNLPIIDPNGTFSIGHFSQENKIHFVIRLTGQASSKISDQIKESNISFAPYQLEFHDMLSDLELINPFKEIDDAR